MTVASQPDPSQPGGATATQDPQKAQQAGGTPSNPTVQRKVYLSTEWDPDAVLSLDVAGAEYRAALMAEAVRQAKRNRTTVVSKHYIDQAIASIGARRPEWPSNLFGLATAMVGSGIGLAPVAAADGANVWWQVASIGLGIVGAGCGGFAYKMMRDAR